MLMHGGQFTIWTLGKTATFSHGCCRFYSVTNIVMSCQNLQLSNAGWACLLNVPLNCVCLCVWVCVYFVLESWLALNYWCDVSVALFRVVNCILLPQSTNAAFQIFLRGSIWVKLSTCLRMATVSSYGINAIYCNCNTVHENKVFFFKLNIS